MNFFSIGRLPIGRGMRPRRCYKTPVTPKMPIQHKRNTIIISDEENTSEYSHSPSSQHSTLESNPDMPEVLQKMAAANTKTCPANAILNQTTTNTTASYSESESSETESGEDDDDEESYDLPTVSSAIHRQGHTNYSKKKSSTPGGINSSTVASISTTTRDSNTKTSSVNHQNSMVQSNTNRRSSKNIANTRQPQQQRNHKNDIISIPTYEKDGAINMV